MATLSYHLYNHSSNDVILSKIPVIADESQKTIIKGAKDAFKWLLLVKNNKILKAINKNHLEHMMQLLYFAILEKS